MNDRQIELVQATFEQVKPISEIAADLFYGRLFELDHTLRPYFSDDLTKQKKKLMTALAFVVAGLNRPDFILPILRELGQRHVDYGVQPHYYHTVGAALLWTLRQGLGEAYTDEVEIAWAAAYSLLSEVMVGETAVLEPA